MPLLEASAAQVSVDETTTQLEQSEIVLFGAVVGGSTRYESTFGTNKSRKLIDNFILE